MSKLIERDAAVEVLNELVRERFSLADGFQFYIDALKDVELNVMALPTVDAVPVVRCKDCIRYRPDDDVWGQCTVMPYRMRKNDYCSYGVIDDMRKDGKDGDHEQTKKPE